MSKYELTVILDGKVTPAKIKALGDRMSSVISLLKGKVEKTDEWGKRDLSGKIGKIETGYYRYMELELDAGNVKKLTDKLRTDEDIIRYLLLKV